MNPCIDCHHKCCRGEHLYTTPWETPVLHVDGDDCHNLLLEKGCRVYTSRPVECQMFPIDIQRVDGDLWWVLWDCPLSREIDTDVLLKAAQDAVGQNGGVLYAEAYVAHHAKVNLPQYREGFTPLVPLD